MDIQHRIYKKHSEKIYRYHQNQQIEKERLFEKGILYKKKVKFR